jgi:hypothetical protein
MFKNHPKGLLQAALSNMGERFGYYIMNAVLLLFLVSKFGLSDGTAGLIYAIFYFGIYILSLVGGLIADRTQNYNRTIQIGLFIMAAGYVALSIPLFSKTAEGLIANGTGGWWGILIFTCIALLCIAFGNGLFKGNLQALVGKLYDEFEAEAAKKEVQAVRYIKDRIAGITPEKAADVYNQSDTFHEQFTSLPNAETVPYWQGSGTNYDLNSITSINVTIDGANDGTDIVASGILGIMFDRDALGVCNQDRRVTTHYNARAEFFNNWYKVDAQYFNDFDENIVVFYANDTSE